MRIIRAGICVSVLAIGAVLLTACDKPERDAAPVEQVRSGGQDGLVDVAYDFDLSADGVVSWTPGKLVTNEQGMPGVVAEDGASADSARLSPRAEFFTPSGCEEPFGEVNVDDDGLGTTACEPTAYYKMSGHYAPQIVLGEDGRVVKILDRYHP